MAITPPPQSSLNKWKLLPSVLSRAFIDPLVVIPVMGGRRFDCGDSRTGRKAVQQNGHCLCIVFGLLGAASAIYQMRRLYRLDAARTLISRLVAEGQQVVLYVSTRSQDRDTYTLMDKWSKRVEGVLKEYLDESYVTRFHLGGSHQEDFRSMSVYEQNHRLEALSDFLKELR